MPVRLYSMSHSHIAKFKRPRDADGISTPACVYVFILLNGHGIILTHERNGLWSKMENVLVSRGMFVYTKPLLCLEMA